jgi:hypothetical protein
MTEDNTETNRFNCPRMLVHTVYPRTGPQRSYVRTVPMCEFHLIIAESLCWPNPLSDVKAHNAIIYVCFVWVLPKGGKQVCLGTECLGEYFDLEG